MTNHPPAADQWCSSACSDASELVAAADGDAFAPAQEHVRTCATCAARANVDAELQAQLRRRLHRLFCPSSEELAGFHEGTLAPERVAQLAEHIVACPHCTRELHWLHELLGPPAHQHAPRATPLP